MLMLRHLLFMISAVVVAASTSLTLDKPFDVSYTSQCGEYTYFEVDFPYPCKDLNISVVTLSGNPQIYVSNTLMYPTKRDLTWSAVETDSLVISYYDPESSPGTYYIGVYAYCLYEKAAAVFKIAAYSSNSTLQESDIYLNSSVSYQKYILEEAYTYFHFCVPQCADVVVSLQNCLSYEECGDTYSYPELLVTRLQTSPTIYDYTYKLATTRRRNITITHRDPTALDKRGFMEGSYYVGVYGWCTPDDQVINWETDGPCSYAAKTLFNVTVQLTFYDASECAASNLVYPTADPDTQLIQYDEEVTGVVDCRAYRYYKLMIPDPCYSLNIYVGGSTLNSSAPEYAMGKWPNLRPILVNHLAWTSYNFVDQNQTISVWDPNFDGGSTCGMFKNETCYYIIGVYGYCAGEPLPVNFTLRTHRVHMSNNIINTPLTNQTIAAKTTNSYGFCVSDETNVTAEFLRWRSSCDCPSKYANLQMIISMSNPNATGSDLTWSIDRDEEFSSIDILTTDPTTRAGTYYLNVYGYCTEDASCTDLCTCAPCGNLPDTRYELYVKNDTAINATYNQIMYQATCDDPASASVICTEECTSSGGNDQKLSPGGISGIVIGGIVFLILCVLAGIYGSRYAYRKWYYSQAKDGEDDQLSMHAEDRASVADVGITTVATTTRGDVEDDTAL